MSNHDPNVPPSPTEDASEGVIRQFGADPDEALIALMRVLASAGAIHARQPNERDGAKQAMHAMAWFMKQRGNPMAAALFHKLLCCLEDLDTGMVSDLIKPVVYGNRPPDPSRKRDFKALALACVRRLCSMDQPLSVGEARRTVANWLNEIPGFSDSKCTAVTLKNWQQKYKDDTELTRLQAMLENTLSQAKTNRDVRRGLDELGKHYLR